MRLHRLPVRPGLGRHVQHDPRSLLYAVGVLPQSAIKAVHWERRSPILDQGALGSCTGNAAAGWLATDNISRAGMTGIDEALAIELYSLATELDEFSGEYPPDDEGSSGLGAAKALQKKGYLQSYSNAFSFDALAAGLQTSPSLIGTVWYNSMFDTTSDGHIKVSKRSGIAGGHEYLATQLELGEDGSVAKVWIDNSWGESWGESGRAWVTAEEMMTLLADEGDVIVPDVAAVPAPPPPPADSLLVTLTDKLLISHVNSASKLRDQTTDEWVQNRLLKYFHL